MYKGKFDEGWDAYREQVLANQKKLGLIPANAQLPDRSPGVVAWNTLNEDQKKLYARFMEIYASYLTYIDDQIGKLINHLKDINQLDNTMVFVMIGDNGASKEGTYNGVISQSPIDKQLTAEQAVQKNLQQIDDIRLTKRHSNKLSLGLGAGM
jgi:arylsulfatase